MKRTAIAALALSMVATLPAAAFDPPTMGWSTWNTFALNINEQVIRTQAEAMVKTGLSKAGYKYVNIDDGYWDGRAADGKLKLNTKLFPSGMRALTDYIHKLGLKAGIYSDAGDNTCGSGNVHSWGIGVGLYGHDQEDCNLYFKDWNFDFIKVDYCGGAHLRLNEQERYTAIHNAIVATGKKGAQFNICRWAYPGTWASDVANSWRTTGDINCSWGSLKSIIKENLYLSAFTGDGHYNDMDMLEIGRTMTHDEEITHMVMWCITSSPMLIGCDMSKIPEFSLNLLKNPELIAWNQDKLGISSPVVQREGDVYVFAKDLKKVRGNERAVAVCNLTDEAKTISVSLDAIGFEGAVDIHDAVACQDLEKGVTGTYSVQIPAHGTRAFVVKGARNEPKVYEAEASWLKAYQEISNKQTANFQANDAASGGEFVGYIGKSADNYLLWKNVFSKKGGNYTLTFKYMSGESRNMTVTVNGQAVKELTGLNSGDWNTFGTCTVQVNLKKGFNTVKLSNDTDWAPNIDCMELAAN